jgi:hypothetical protein
VKEELLLDVQILSREAGDDLGAGVLERIKVKVAQLRKDYSWR